MYSWNISESCYDSYLAQIGCIFSYDWDTFQITLNYFLLILNFVCWFLSISKTIKLSKDQQKQKLLEVRQLKNGGKNIFDYDDYEKIPLLSNRYFIFAFIALVLLFLVQIGFSIILEFLGVSIVWVALDGWIARDLFRRHRQEDEQDMGFIVFFFGLTLLDSVVIIYYLFMDAPSITAARICAHLLGSVLSQMSLDLFYYFRCGRSGKGEIDNTIDTEIPSDDEEGVFDDVVSGLYNEDDEGKYLGCGRSGKDETPSDDEEDVIDDVISGLYGDDDDDDEYINVLRGSL